jgi:uncharacterized LabA/DUF88 family protein
MSTDTSEKNVSDIESKPLIRVYAFVDGFNLYHALDDFRHARTELERSKYRHYKWLCLHSLLSRYVNEKTERFAGIEYFTAYPTWNAAKELRHKTYVSALISRSVHVTFGEFKEKTISCRALCKTDFRTFEEKQTDVNISVGMVALAEKYDKAILLTEDSDQVPAVRLLKKLHPEKKIFTLAPIGRGSKELQRVCDGKFSMDEKALSDSQLPSPIEISKEGKRSSFIVKPKEWSLPEVPRETGTVMRQLAASSITATAERGKTE